MKENLQETRNPMDEYSHPISVKDTKLGRLFVLKAREKPERPGRSLRVIFDSRFPLIENFKSEYLYTVTFDKKGDQAGNHYHKVKSELFYPVAGKLEVHLQNPKNKEHEIIELKAENHVALSVQPGIAHKVIAKDHNAILMVIASAPNVEADEFPYEISLSN